MDNLLQIFHRFNRQPQAAFTTSVWHDHVESVSNSTVTTPEPSPTAGVFDNVTDAFNIQRELAELLLEYCHGDIDGVAEWLTNVLCGGSDLENAVKDLHRYFAFGQRRGEVDDTIYMEFGHFKENEGPSLRNQILLQWKSKKDQFKKLANVKFDQGIGEGPQNTYLQAIREFILAPLFEGADDHLIVTAATDQYMEREYYLGGQFMGHIVRHGQPVIPGLAQVTKCIIRGVEVELLHAAMEDLPSFDTQQLLEKVICGEEKLNEDENMELMNLINDSGLKSGVSWVAANASARGCYKVKDEEKFNVVEAIAQYIVLFKRTLQMQQLIAGFEDVCKFRAFLGLCGGVGGNEIADILMGAYFPTMSEACMTKSDVTNMFVVEVVQGEEEYQAAAFAQLLKIVAQLNEDPKAQQSVSKFLQLFTASPCVPLDTKITFNVGDYIDFEPHVCSKTVDVSKKWFESDESKNRFVEFVLSEVRATYQNYNGW